MRTEEEIRKLLKILHDDMSGYPSHGVEVSGTFSTFGKTTLYLDSNEGVVDWSQALEWVLNEEE